MSPAESVDHRRTHNLLLVSRLLSLRDTASPFTLLLDSLSQSSRPLVREYIERAITAKCKTVFVSFSTFSPPQGITTLISARRKPIPVLQKEIFAACSANGSSKTLLILDSLNPLCSSAPSSLAPFLSSLLSPTTTLVAMYHTDVPLCLPPEGSANAYPDSAPQPLTLLSYFATTIITVHSITHMLAAKAARDRSLAPPGYGLDEGVDGVLVGLGSNPAEGVVLELEYRRKSGRGVGEWFFLPGEGEAAGMKRSVLPGGVEEKVMLLEDHPRWKESEAVKQRGGAGEEEEPMSTFELGLTESQRKARDEVVLPYFDAQREGGIGGGGAILFTPDREIDDFDDEEDEI
ncbi:Elongator complex protein 5 [Tricharina praecox]|uniref:Elongator complex protein 5 n=1 Tax=Tricharina praecox TaxID=43433 RepID=UPI0022205A8F|nr:Elongator complex protein 5 [Tricharina praecox]KAI5852234.1 Elongator complex protein 5 [Tricharina praecox]